LTLDLDGYKAYAGSNRIDLTPREFEILRELLMHRGRIFTRQNLLQTLWKYEFFGDERIIDTHIKNLRKNSVTRTTSKQSEGWDIELIKKIRSSLSVKVFVLTAVLMAACCTVTYLCIARFSPYIYAHRLEDAEELARLAYLELLNYNFSESELKYDIQLL